MQLVILSEAFFSRVEGSASLLLNQLLFNGSEAHFSKVEGPAFRLPLFWSLRLALGRHTILSAMRLLLSSLFLMTSLTAFGQTTALATTVWQMQEPGTTASLRGIHSVDGKVAWASGTGGTVLKTTDGGVHWQTCAVPDAATDGATLDFRGVQAWDADTAIVMASGPGEKSRLYKTTDGCKTWRMLFKNPDKDGFWDAVSVADQDSIMILGDPVGSEFYISSSADGGKTWSREQYPGLRSKEKEGAFAASNSALLVDWVDDYVAFGTGSPFGARLFHGCDSCKTGTMWSATIVSSFSKGTASGIFSLNFRDWKRWAAVGGDYTKPNASTGTAAWSADSGGTWTASAIPPHGYRSSVQWSEALRAWITVGTNGSDISRDDGKTWQPLDDGDWNALSLPFVVGPKGRIARLNAAAFQTKRTER
jgi:photosystem II stability/assembly factor-like uncharacterized protein